MACDTSILDAIMELRGEETLTTSTLNSIDSATYQMQDIYKEREPYTTSRKITGTEYVFGETFLDKVKYAMATDDLDSMNNSELDVWNYFVQFEDEDVELLVIDLPQALDEVLVQMLNCEDYLTEDEEIQILEEVSSCII